jgi:hypothetical protein
MDEISPYVRLGRRGVIRAAIKAATAAVIGTALVGQKVLPAAAASGDNVTAGNRTLAESGTSVGYDGPAGFTGVVLLGNDTGFANSGALYPAAAGGWAGATVANGVYGYSNVTNGNAVVGYHDNGIGGGNGVLGKANSATAVGVLGTNTSGTGVSGTSASGVGVEANGGSGIGVRASGDIGLQASGSSAALDVSGPVNFNRAGTVSIGAGSKTVTVGGWGPLTGSSFMLATAQNNAGVWVTSAVPNVPRNSFKITLNKAVPAGKIAVVGFFVVG